MVPDLDDVGRGILYLLQLDARSTTAQEIAEETDVVASTVRNGIERLEADGMITSYRPTIDYEAADFHLEVMFVATASPTGRTEVVENLVDIRDVVDVRETHTGGRNLYVEAVSTSKSDISRITDSIHQLGLETESSERVNHPDLLPRAEGAR